MKKEQFWATLDQYWCHGDMPQFWELVNSHRHFMDEFMEKLDKELADPNSKRRKEADTWWADLKPKLIDNFGEEWVKENFTDSHSTQLP